MMSLEAAISFILTRWLALSPFEEQTLLMKHTQERMTVQNILSFPLPFPG